MHLRCVEAVVVELAGIVARSFGLDTNVCKAVELRPDLADFRAEIFFIGNNLVRPTGPKNGGPGILRFQPRVPKNGMPASYTRPRL